MPVILEKSDEIKWANSEHTFNEVEPLLKPYPSKKIRIEEETKSSSSLDLFRENWSSNLSKQFCTIYNNQMFFNESISKFISRMEKNDILVLFSDTPPMFSGKRRIHFEDTIDIYAISRI